MSKTIEFANLTNGLHFVRGRESTAKYRYLRIQSTACEQKRWSAIVEQLSDDFLMHLALGDHCIVYDASSRDRILRAIWQGLTMIEYFCCRSWGLYTGCMPFEGRMRNCRGYANEQWCRLSRTARRKLKYFRPFVKPGLERLYLGTFCSMTTRDGDKQYFANRMFVDRADQDMFERMRNELKYREKPEPVINSETGEPT